ncbi:MAG: hypothetical protein HY879_00095 [Deltaproteobacteria bacterium]|nr:hypothetical protein [Deltaproteobacteria bacterium]
MVETTGVGLFESRAPKRIILRNPVREFCTPGSVRGQSGNWLSYLDPLLQDHKGKKRVNNSPVGLETPELDREKGKKFSAFNPLLDPHVKNHTLGSLVVNWMGRPVTQKKNLYYVLGKQNKLWNLTPTSHFFNHHD